MFSAAICYWSSRWWQHNSNRWKRRSTLHSWMSTTVSVRYFNRHVWSNLCIRVQQHNNVFSIRNIFELHWSAVKLQRRQSDVLVCAEDITLSHLKNIARSITSNHLTGTISSSIGQLTALSYLCDCKIYIRSQAYCSVTLRGLYSNQLTGTIHPSIAQLTALKHLCVVVEQLRCTHQPSQTLVLQSIDWNDTSH
jgi:hypothetical protein